MSKKGRMIVPSENGNKAKPVLDMLDLQEVKHLFDLMKGAEAVANATITAAQNMYSIAQQDYQNYVRVALKRIGVKLPDGVEFQLNWDSGEVTLPKEAQGEREEGREEGREKVPDQA